MFGRSLCLLLLLASVPSYADAASRVLVLPLRPVGVGEQTTVVTGVLLAGSLGDLGVDVVTPDPSQAPLPSGAGACDDAGCAGTIGRSHGADRVVYGSINRLGAKYIVRINVLRVEETSPYYRDQLTAVAEEDLDTVMRRFAEGIAAGRPNSDRASVESVTQAETIDPPRRATRYGFGVRAGFLFPTGNSYPGNNHLSSILSSFRTEVGDYMIETTPLIGFNWGEGNLDWTLLDMSVSRLFGRHDFTGFAGLGFGVHIVRVDRTEIQTVTYPGTPPYTYTYPVSVEENKTVPTMDLIIGGMGLRTYDTSVILELRFHIVFADFEKLGGARADGLRLTFGTSRSRPVQ